ncbi:hypothetical protein [Streptomyces sp. CA-106131]|uniref:hypothetical protein n=1 Tax=Streptomyces sp. CA-106131 TaxID=3240045 RepID=UPI003D94FE40
MAVSPAASYATAQVDERIEHPDGPRAELPFDAPPEEWLHAHTSKAETVDTLAGWAPHTPLGQLTSWRLLQVEPIGTHHYGAHQQRPHWIKMRSLRVTGEAMIREALGPNGTDVLALYERVTELTPQDAERLAARWHARDRLAWHTADRRRTAALADGRRAAGEAARQAGNAVLLDLTKGLCAQTRNASTSLVEALMETLVVRDLLDDRHYCTLTRPWQQALGALSEPHGLVTAGA